MHCKFFFTNLFPTPQDLGAKQASPAPRSPFCRRKSRRGKRRSPLVKKPEVLRGPSLASHGQEREEKLMHEKITKLLPTTMLVTLSPDDIEVRQFRIVLFDI